MSWLVDTNVIARTIHSGSPLQQSAINAISLLRARGEILFVVPQNLIEFWAIATRPLSANGLGFCVEDAEKEIAKIKLHFILKAENESIFGLWEKLGEDIPRHGKDQPRCENRGGDAGSQYRKSSYIQRYGF